MTNGKSVDGGVPDFKRLRNRRPLRILSNEIPAYLASFKPRSRPGCIIFAQGRTGTWLLHSLLNQHPELHFDKEILQPPVIAPTRFVRGKAKSTFPKLYGCHIQINQLIATQKCDPLVFLKEFERDGWCIIHVSRDDIVRQSISAILAVQRRHWVSCHTNEAGQNALKIDITQVIDRIRRRQGHLVQEAEILGNVEHLALNYERDLQDASMHQSTGDRIFEYLGVDRIAVAAGTYRTNPANLKDVITNFEPLMARISQEFPDLNMSA